MDSQELNGIIQTCYNQMALTAREQTKERAKLLQIVELVLEIKMLNDKYEDEQTRMGY
jgi:hypothetical protein